MVYGSFGTVYEKNSIICSQVVDASMFIGPDLNVSTTIGWTDMDFLYRYSWSPEGEAH